MSISDANGGTPDLLTVFFFFKLLWSNGEDKGQEVYNDWAGNNANYDIYFIDAKGNLCHESVTHDWINQHNHVHVCVRARLLK